MDPKALGFPFCIATDSLQPPPSTQALGDSLQETKRCSTCRRFILVTQYDLHMDHHIQQQHLRETQERIHANEQDKCGIEVGWKDGIDFSVVQPDTIVEIEVRVTNKATTKVIFQSCRIGGRDLSEHDK